MQIKFVQLAISGRVPVKIVNESGNIEIEDLLVSSFIPRRVMKCADTSKCTRVIIRKAISIMNESEGEITIMVMLN